MGAESTIEVVGEWRNGRRACLRSMWLRPCGFESRLPHHGVFAQLGEEWFNVCIAIVMNRKGDTPCIARRV